MTARTCPICGKTAEGPEATKLAPFCSSRCKDVDLHRWLSGQYAIPAVEQDDSDAAEDGQGEVSAPAAGRRPLLH